MVSVLLLVNIVLTILMWIVIISAILSWLVAFNIVNTRNPVVNQVAEVLYRVTEPLLRPIRSILPTIGGIDFSPIALLLVIWLIQDLNSRYLIPAVARAGL